GVGCAPQEVGAGRVQSDAQQPVEGGAARDGVEIDVVEDRAGDQRQDHKRGERYRGAVTPRAETRFRICGGRRGGCDHERSTTTKRRPKTSTGTPSLKRSTTNV